MMKKVIYSILPLFIFMIYTNVYAAPVCDQADQNLYEYATTLYGRKALDEATKENSEYTYSVCCSTDTALNACDFYKNASSSTDAEKSNQNSTVDYSGLKDTFIIIGHVIRLAKILIPIIIIGFGMFDLFKAIVGSKDDEIKKSFKSLIMRCLAGVCIFFLPAFIDLIFSWVDGWETTYQGSYEECFKCIWDVGSCK